MSTKSRPPNNVPEQLAVLSAVVDGMAEGVWTTDRTGQVVQHNNALKELLYTGGDIVGQRAKDLFDGPELEDAVRRACDEGASNRLELQLEGVRPRTLSVHVSPLGRGLDGSFAVFVDVTELRRLEKIRRDFVANVSHELRTPITAIRGYAETLQSGALNDPSNAPRMVDIILRQSERLSALVEDLLELSRLESRQLQLQEAAVDLAEAAQRTVDSVSPKAKEREIQVFIDVPEGLKVVGDERGLEQVLLNLVENAIKYSRPGGRVWVAAARQGEDIELTVRDDGPGIEQKHLPRIFERFYRVDKGRSRDMGGTGLGLSIVKHIVTAMNGDVRVESKPGHGSTFFVRLPVSQAPAAPGPQGGNLSAPE